MLSVRPRPCLEHIQRKFRGVGQAGSQRYSGGLANPANCHAQPHRTAGGRLRLYIYPIFVRPVRVHRMSAEKLYEPARIHVMAGTNEPHLRADLSQDGAVVV